MPARIEQIDHTADVGLRIVATTPADAFSALAEGMVDFMVERAGLEAAARRPVTVRGNGWEDLIVRWLEEILYLYESEGFVAPTVQLPNGAPTSRESCSVRPSIRHITSWASRSKP